MITYKKTNGQAHDLQFKDIPDADDIVLEGDILPDIKTLHDVPDRAAWLDSDVRPRRNQLLDEVDLRHCNAERWDSMTITLKEAWAAYKQALRDLPDTIDHDNPVWPTMPG